MLQILVEIKFKDFELGRQYETIALGQLSKYNSKLISAFKPKNSVDLDIDEIHLLEFKSEADFFDFRNDQTILSLSELREKAIEKIKLVFSENFIEYKV